MDMAGYHSAKAAAMDAPKKGETRHVDAGSALGAETDDEEGATDPDRESSRIGSVSYRKN
jgi:hypothetical protein